MHTGQGAKAPDNKDELLAANMARPGESLGSEGGRDGLLHARGERGQRDGGGGGVHARPSARPTSRRGGGRAGGIVLEVAQMSQATFRECPAPLSGKQLFARSCEREGENKRMV